MARPFPAGRSAEGRPSDAASVADAVRLRGEGKAVRLCS